MNVGAELAELREQFRERPLAVIRSLGELLTVAVLLVGTFVLLSRGITEATRPLWLALVVLGTGFVLLPTLVDPLRREYRRLAGTGDAD
ncbi:MAG: hypothetical protein ABEJ05_06945 [Haloglomus sp.]